MDFRKLFDEELNKEAIINRLTDFSKELKQGSEIIVIGSSAIILTIDTKRKTMDIDILNTVKSLAYSKYNLQIVNEGILFLLEDYKSRLILISEVNGVTIRALGLLDVALVKLGRGLEKDIDDCKEIINSGKVSLGEFELKYSEFRNGYGGNDSIIDNNYWAVTGKKFKG